MPLVVFLPRPTAMHRRHGQMVAPEHLYRAGIPRQMAGPATAGASPRTCR